MKRKKVQYHNNVFLNNGMNKISSNFILKVFQLAHTNLVTSFLNVIVGKAFVNKSARLSLDLICCRLISPLL